MYNHGNRWYDERNYADVIARRVANGSSAHDSLDININIDKIIPNRNPETLQLTEAAIDAEMPFILHNEFERHVLIIPKTMAIVSYKNGVKVSVQFAKNYKQFANLVKMCIFLYWTFYIPIKKIQDNAAPDLLELPASALPVWQFSHGITFQQALSIITRNTIRHREAKGIPAPPDGYLPYPLRF